MGTSEPTVEVIWLEHYRHGFGMNRSDKLIGLAGKECHERPRIAWPPDTGECENGRFLVGKPNLALPLGQRIRFGRPFTEFGHWHEAASARLLEGRTPERTCKIADVGDRSSSRGLRAWKTPVHHFELHSAVAVAFENRRGAARKNIVEWREVVAVSVKRAEHPSKFVDGRCHAVEVAHAPQLSFRTPARKLIREMIGSTMNSRIRVKDRRRRMTELPNESVASKVRSAATPSSKPGVEVVSAVLSVARRDVCSGQIAVGQGGTDRTKEDSNHQEDQLAHSLSLTRKCRSEREADRLRRNATFVRRGLCLAWRTDV